MRFFFSFVLALILPTPLAAQAVSFANFDGFLSIGTESNRTASIALADVDRDGDLDALVANGRHWAQQNWLFFNDGSAGFKSALPIGRQLDASYAIAAADLNDDGFIANRRAANSEAWNLVYLTRKASP